MIKRLTLSALAAIVATGSLAMTLGMGSPAAADQNDGRHQYQNRDWRGDARQNNHDWRRDQRQSNRDWRRDRNQVYGYNGSGYHNGQYRDRGHRDRDHNPPRY